MSKKLIVLISLLSLAVLCASECSSECHSDEHSMISSGISSCESAEDAWRKHVESAKQVFDVACISGMWKFQHPSDLYELSEDMMHWIYDESCEELNRQKEWNNLSLDEIAQKVSPLIKKWNPHDQWDHDVLLERVHNGQLAELNQQMYIRFGTQSYYKSKHNNPRLHLIETYHFIMHQLREEKKWEEKYAHLSVAEIIPLIAAAIDKSKLYNMLAQEMYTPYEYVTKNRLKNDYDSALKKIRTQEAAEYNKKKYEAELPAFIKQLRTYQPSRMQQQFNQAIMYGLKPPFYKKHLAGNPHLLADEPHLHLMYAHDDIQRNPSILVNKLEDENIREQAGIFFSHY